MANIFCVEDDTGIRELITCALQSGGYTAKGFPDGKSFFQRVQEEQPALILLDIMLPDEDGISILKRLKSDAATAEIPVIMLSAKSSEIDKVTGLENGADDYITKPFGSAELLARIRTSLRHSTRMNTSSDQLFHPYKCGELILDFEKRTLTISGNIVHLTPIEYKILVFLAQNCGKVMRYSSIINNVWGPYADYNNRILRVNMTNIRRKIEKNPADPQYIFTEVGVGYRMSEEHC